MQPLLSQKQIGEKRLKFGVLSLYVVALVKFPGLIFCWVLLYLEKLYKSTLFGSDSVSLQF